MRATTFQLEPVPAGHGADDYETDRGAAYTLRALHDGEPVGRVDFNELDGTLRIRWIEVTLPREQIATRLLDELARLHPEAAWETGGFTEDGEAFLDAYGDRRGRYVEQRDDTPDDE